MFACFIVPKYLVEFVPVSDLNLVQARIIRVYLESTKGLIYLRAFICLELSIFLHFFYWLISVRLWIFSSYLVGNLDKHRNALSFLIVDGWPVTEGQVVLFTLLKLQLGFAMGKSRSELFFRTCRLNGLARSNQFLKACLPTCLSNISFLLHFLVLLLTPREGIKNSWSAWTTYWVVASMYWNPMALLHLFLVLDDG